MHLQPVFDCGLATDTHRHSQTKKKRYEARIVGGEVAEDLFNRGLCLPSGTVMTEDDLNRVIDVIIKCKKQEIGKIQFHSFLSSIIFGLREFPRPLNRVNFQT